MIETRGGFTDKMSCLFYKGFSDEEILRPDSGLEKILKNLEVQPRTFSWKNEQDKGLE